jgi:hypothetical protein
MGLRQVFPVQTNRTFAPSDDVVSGIAITLPQAPPASSRSKRIPEKFRRQDFLPLLAVFSGCPLLQQFKQFYHERNGSSQK